MKIMNKDKECFESICKTGHVRREHMNSLKINDNRISTYIKEGYIKKEINNSVESFKLTREGHKLAEREMNIHNHYKAQSYNHDIAIADKYFSLDYRERDTFETEKELQDKLRDYIEELKETDYDRAKELERDYEEHKLSVPDCCFTTAEGVVVAFEVVTANYSKQEIEAKQEYCREFQMQYEEERR